MATAKLIISGEIHPFNENANANHVFNFFADNSDADDYEITINSPGGSVIEGLAMFDAIKNLSDGKKITTIAYTCFSIATLMFLTGEDRFISANGSFLVHNPFVHTAGGDASKLRRSARQLQKMENRMASIYSEATGLDVAEIKRLMKKDEIMEPEAAVSAGFATALLTNEEDAEKAYENSEILAETYEKAVAYFGSDNTNKNLVMNIKEMVDAAVAKAFGNNKSSQNEDPTALMIALEDGKNLTIETEAMQAAEGDAVSFEGDQVPDGTYNTAETQMAFKVEQGKIVEIIDLNPQFDSEDVQAFVSDAMVAFAERFRTEQADAISGFVPQAKFDEKVAELDEAKEMLAKAIEDIKTLTGNFETEVEAIKAQITSNPEAGNAGAYGANGSSVGLEATDPTEAAIIKRRQEYSQA